MVDKAGKKNNALIWVGVILIALLVGLAGGLGLASSVLDSSEEPGLKSALLDSQARIAQLQAEADDLQTTLDAMDSASQALTQELTQEKEDLRVQLSQAQAQATLAQEQVQSIQSQMAKAQDKLETARAMSDALERHRLLLVELRKDSPQTREESTAYWSNIKTLAARADPALASPADRVILKIDNFFDWDDRSPGPASSSTDYLNWLADYTTSGASAYEEAAARFTRDALQAVVTQMDSVIAGLN